MISEASLGEATSDRSANRGYDPPDTGVIPGRLAPAAELYGERPLIVSKWAVTSVLRCEGLYVAPTDFGWTLANVRGKVVHRAIQISLAGRGRSMSPLELSTTRSTRSID